MKIDHIYCVNLERSKVRKSCMINEFSREELDVEFFKACDGAEYARDGAFGCAQSHIQIWKDIVEKGYENALILEDDVRLVHDFKRKLDDLNDTQERVNFQAGQFDDQLAALPGPLGQIGSGIQSLLGNTALNNLNFLDSNAYGISPANTTLTVTYWVGGGVNSNTPSNTIVNVSNLIVQNDTTAYTNQDLVTFNSIVSSLTVNNEVPATGGGDGESIDEIRENALGFFNAQNRHIYRRHHHNHHHHYHHHHTVTPTPSPSSPPNP